MARNHIPTAQQRRDNEGNEITEAGEETPPPGAEATPGIETRTTMPDDKFRHSAVIPEKPDAPKRRQYEVMNVRDTQILYNGAVSTMRPGKVVDDVAYDLETLRKQGIKLREMNGEETGG